MGEEKKRGNSSDPLTKKILTTEQEEQEEIGKISKKTHSKESDMIGSVYNGSYGGSDQLIPFDVLSSNLLKRVDQMGGDQLERFHEMKKSNFTQKTEGALDLAGLLITQAIIVDDLTLELIEQAVPTKTCASIIQSFLKPLQIAVIAVEQPHESLQAAEHILVWHSDKNKEVDILKRDRLLSEWIESARSIYRLWVLQVIPLFSKKKLQNIHFDREYAQKTTFEYKVSVLTNLLAFKVTIVQRQNVMKMEYIKTRGVSRFSLIAKYLKDIFNNHKSALSKPSNNSQRHEIVYVIMVIFNEFVLLGDFMAHISTHPWANRFVNSFIVLSTDDLKSVFFRILSTHDDEALRKAWVEELQKEFL